MSPLRPLEAGGVRSEGGGTTREGRERKRGGRGTRTGGRSGERRSNMEYCVVLVRITPICDLPKAIYLTFIYRCINYQINTGINVVNYYTMYIHNKNET